MKFIQAKVEEYTKFAKEVSIPFWLSRPGITEFRAYREPGSLKVLVEMDFEDWASYGAAFDEMIAQCIDDKFAVYTHGAEYSLWAKSPLIPAPLKPK